MAAHTQACLDDGWETEGAVLFSSFRLASLPAHSPSEATQPAGPTAGCAGRGWTPVRGPSPLPCLRWSLIMGVRVSGQGCGRTRGSASYKHLGESVRPRAGDVAFGGVERHVVDGLLELLPVSRELLDAGFTLQVPQPDGAVVTCGGREGQAPYLRLNQRCGTWGAGNLLPDIR